MPEGVVALGRPGSRSTVSESAEPTGAVVSPSATSGCTSSATGTTTAMTCVTSCDMSDAIRTSSRSLAGSSGSPRCTGSTTRSIATRESPGSSGGRGCAMATTRRRALAGVLVLFGLAFLALVAYGLSNLAVSEPQSRAYVAGSSSAPVFGYRPCGSEGIRSLTVRAVRGDRSDLIWSVQARGAVSAPVLRVRLWEVPVGFEETVALPGTVDSDRLSFHVERTSGGDDGRAFDLSEIRDGSVLWSDGYAAGDNLDAIASSHFGC
jgi:hypothetical protein